MTVDRASLLGMIRHYPDWPRPGTDFRDVRDLLAERGPFHSVVDEIADHFSQGITDPGGGPVTTVLGVEHRGLALGGAVAYRLHAGFAAVRKAGRLPAEVEEREFALEYGSDLLQVPREAVGAGQRVVVVDAVLGSGATLAATRRLARRGGAEVVGVAVLLELAGGRGRAQLDGCDVFSVVREPDGG